MELNREAIAEFLSLGYALDDQTFRLGEETKLKVVIPDIRTYDSTLSDVENTLKESISKSTKGKDKIGVLLSGGKDARLLIGLANSLDLNVTAVTVGDKNNRDEEFAASNVAKSLNIPFQTIRIPDDIKPNLVDEIGKVTDGLISFSSVAPTYLIRKELSDNFDMVLSGNLMTEIMDTCEYRWYDSKNPSEVMKRKHLKGSKVLKNDYAKNVEDSFISKYEDNTLEEIILDTEFKNRSRGVLTINKLMNIPLIAPAADKEVISATFSLPLENRINGRLVTEILKKSYPDLAKIRSSKTLLPLFFPWWIHYGTHHIKDKIFYFQKGKRIWAGSPRSNKMGMWDQGYVYKYKIGEYVKSSLGSFDFDIINKDFVTKVLENHFAETVDNSGYIPRLLTLKNWLDKNN